MKKPEPLKRMTEELRKIPGIGPRMAERTAFFLQSQGPDFLEGLASAVEGLKNLVRCSECRAVSESSPCATCSDATRDAKKLAVVATLADAEAIEKTGRYNGHYFVLGALVSPIDGVRVSDMPVGEMVGRIEKAGVEEVIIATDPNSKGETTALVIADALKDVRVRVTRLAYGLPFGGDLEYADEITLSKALDGRRDFGALE